MLCEAEKAGKRLLIGQNQRFAKAHVKAKELLQDGVIGKVITFRTVFGHGGPETWSISPGKGTWFFDKSKAAMGAMADLGIHKTDLLRFLLDQDVTNDNQTASGVIDEFVAAVEEGRPSILDAEDVLKSMEAVFASMLSAEQGRTVEVDELFGQ